MKGNFYISTDDKDEIKSFIDESIKQGYTPTDEVKDFLRNGRMTEYSGVGLFAGFSDVSDDLKISFSTDICMIPEWDDDPNGKRFGGVNTIGKIKRFKKISETFRKEHTSHLNELLKNPKYAISSKIKYSSTDLLWDSVMRNKPTRRVITGYTFSTDEWMLKTDAGYDWFSEREYKKIKDNYED